MSYYFKKSDGTIGSTAVRDAKRKRDPFTVLPEFGITVFDHNRNPYDPIRGKPVYAHVPSLNSQFTQQEQKKISSSFQERIFALIDRNPSYINNITPSERVAYQASRKNNMSRKRSYSAYNASRFDADFGPSVAVQLPNKRIKMQSQAQGSLATQVRRLMAGKKKDGADVNRWNGYASASNSATSNMCLSSSTDKSTAVDTTGLITTDSDCATINHVDLQGYFSLSPIACNVAQSISAFGQAEARLIVAWLYKPAIALVAAGTVPAVTEVLVTDSIDAMQLQDTANAGRFTVLSDRRFNLGRALQLSDSSLGTSGNGGTLVPFKYRVKVGKKMEFKAPANDTNKGGHLDSDTSAGQVTKGILCAWILWKKGAGVAGTDCGSNSAFLTTRLNYTA